MTETEAASIESPSAVDVTQASGDENRYVGVGGWLAFFCASLTFLNPLMTLFNVVSGVATNAPYFGEMPGLLALILTDSAVSVAIAGFSLFAGVALWRRRPKAVQTVLIYLLIGIVYTLLAPFSPLLLGLNETGRQAVIDAAFSTMGTGALYYIIWTNYVLRSKRVRATYPDWNPPTPKPSTGPAARWYHYIAALAAIVLIFAVAFYLTG